MKALRYLLIVMLLSVVSVAFSANAQNLAERPRVEMQSTSGMVYSGSTLPQAAAEGAYVTGATIGTYTPANGSSSGPRRGKRGLDPDDDIPVPGDNEDPDKTPIGDAMWPLMLLALAYVSVRAFLSSKRKMAQK